MESAVATLNEILECLDRERVRATYDAVGEVLELPARSVGRQLRNHARQTCWVVSARTGRPTDYSDERTHPELFRTPRIINTGAELMQLPGLAEEDDDMTSVFAMGNIPWSCRNITPHAAAQALHEVRESRRRQDTKLQTRLRAAITTIILYVATMAVATTASGKFASLTATLMFVGAMFLLVTLAFIVLLLPQWNDQPELTHSLLSDLSEQLKPQNTDLYLMDVHIEAHNQNNKTLGHVLGWLWLHIGMAVAGGVIAMLALLEIVPALIDQPDESPGTGCEVPLNHEGEEASGIVTSEPGCG